MQYLKFGFPLCLNNPDQIHDTVISNHFQTFYILRLSNNILTKRKHVELYFVLFAKVLSKYFHCLPMLTRPKDLNKRRVILNLSYSKGVSLNDNVDKLHFDGKKIILKFPTTDDICDQICSNFNEVLLSKIDISRAFCNLRVDPCDALKFGISWNGQYYQDLAVAFSWIHGSSYFQLAAEVNTYIMKRKGFKTFAYIDHFILVNSKHKAQ